MMIRAFQNWVTDANEGSVLMLLNRVRLYVLECSDLLPSVEDALNKGLDCHCLAPQGDMYCFTPPQACTDSHTNTKTGKRTFPVLKFSPDQKSNVSR